MSEFQLNCPIPMPPGQIIQMAHGGGGRMSQRLLDEVFFPRLGNASLDRRLDASVVDVGGKRLAISTDGFVVSPWRFPGGDIGSLAVHGTVNDLAMGGARPLGLSAAFILEEGFAMEDLREVVDSMQLAAISAGVNVVAGDTKVVEKGKGDGIYIVTTGVGEMLADPSFGPESLQVGDVLILSGDLGRHGAAVMSVRDGLSLDSPIVSDSAAVQGPALALIEAGIEVRCMRDPTRGGLASILNEIARGGNVDITIDESVIPVQEAVLGISELLGLDPLYMACEGRFVAFVAPQDADRALDVLRSFSVSSGAVKIGSVCGQGGEVSLFGRIGVSRVLDLLSGEQLPRIC